MRTLEPTTVILARAGSKGVPNKNLSIVGGKPLIQWTLDQLRRDGVHDICVSTDGEQIKNYVRQQGCFVIDRPADLGGDNASGEDALIHALDLLEIPNETPVLNPQVTSPLRPPGVFRECLGTLRNTDRDSVFTAVEMADICVWDTSQPRLNALTYDPRNRLNRQIAPLKIVENGSVYAFEAGVLRSMRSKIGARPGYHAMPKWTFPELDEPDDVPLIESLLNAFVLRTR